MSKNSSNNVILIWSLQEIILVGINIIMNRKKYLYACYSSLWSKRTLGTLMLCGCRPVCSYNTWWLQLKEKTLSVGNLKETLNIIVTSFPKFEPSFLYFYIHLPIGREIIAFVSNFWSGYFDGLTRFKDPSIRKSHF